MSDKKEEILKALEKIKEIFPDLDKIVIDDLVNPNYILLTTGAFFEIVAESFLGKLEKEENVPLLPDNTSNNKKKLH